MTSPIKSKPVRRADIIAAAASLFAEVGYERTTVRQLAQKLGLMTGSIFHHFGTKEEILVAVMSHALEDANDRLVEAVGSANEPKERLRAAIEAHLESLLVVARPAMTVITFDWRSLSPAAHEKVVAMRDMYEDNFKKVLRDCENEGMAPADTLHRQWILGALNGTLWWYHHNAPVSVSELADRYVSIIGKGLDFSLD
jgi:TetR/AcrR family transcriptional regulator, cholesterol catabolism regulator